MTLNLVEESTSKPEAKVTSASVGATVASFVLSILAVYVFNVDVSDLPDTVVLLVGTLTPGIVTFVSGYLAKHTYRSREVVVKAASDLGVEVKLPEDFDTRVALAVQKAVGATFHKG